MDSDIIQCRAYKGYKLKLKSIRFLKASSANADADESNTNASANASAVGESNASANANAAFANASAFEHKPASTQYCNNTALQHTWTHSVRSATVCNGSWSYQVGIFDVHVGLCPIVTI